VSDRYRQLSRLIADTDVLCVLAAMLIAHVVRFGVRPIALDFTVVMAVTPLLLLAVFSAFRLYDIQHFSPAEQFRRLVAAVAMTVTTISVVSFWTYASFSRVWLGLTLVLSTVFILASRQYWQHVIGRMRADGRLAYPTLVVGTNDEARRIAHSMTASPLGFDLRGFIRTGGPKPGSGHGLVELGNLRDLPDILADTRTECIFVAASAVDPHQMSQIGKLVRTWNLELRISANIPGTVATRLSVQPFDDSMALSVKPAQLSGRQAFVKRTLDITLSSLAVVVTAPLWLAIAAAIKLTSRGPVLFTQTRVGRRGEHFRLLKFRTMIRGAEDIVDLLRDRNEADGPLFKIRDDPRVTRVGRFLRRWSLDELPQLENVLRGDMSLVGPRPPIPAEVASYEDWHFGRLEVAPGITGLWQVNGRSDLSFEDYVRRDLFYIENWSLSYDLFLLLKTVPAVLTGRGSY
jgi:exopolysaccharide biosynthesis polyprenyl glycosylphosphotransferase